MPFSYECLNLVPSLCLRYRTALETTDSIDEGGGLNWKMVGCLIGAWFLLFVIVFRGVQSVGKVRKPVLFFNRCAVEVTLYVKSFLRR